MPPWDLHFLAWIALVPWLAGLGRTRSTWEAVAQGFWLSFTLGVLTAHWVAYAAHEFLELSWPLSVGVLVAFAATLAQPHLLLVAPVIRWADRKTRATDSVSASLWLALTVALLYAALDATVPRLFDAGLGYALHSAELLRQLADLGGVALLTCLVVFVNVLIWRMWIARHATKARRAILVSHTALIGLVVAAASVYGFVRNRAVGRAIDEAEQHLRVGIVQGNIANEVRLGWARGDERSAEKQLGTYMLLTEDLMKDAPATDLIVWPEATFPGVFQQPLSKLQRGRANKFDRQVLRLRTPIVFGAYDMETESSGRILYNALFAITPNYDKPGSQGFVQRYRKHELLAFAEHIPGLSQTDWFRQNLPSLGFFGAGLGASVFEIKTAAEMTVNLAPFICSESLSARHVIEGVRAGGAILLNVGSDGWFGPLGEPQFHLAVSRLRSIETRKSQIRAANTGISALILPNGKISARSKLGAEDVLNLDVPVVGTEMSLMVRWGDWFGWAALGAALLLLIIIGRRGS